MQVLKKIWNWVFGKKEVESIKKELPKYATGGYVKNAERYVAPSYSEIISNNTVTREREGTKIKGGVNNRPTTPRPNFAPPPQNPSRDFKREANEYFRQQQARRDSDDNFLMGAMVGYVIADSLNDNNTVRDLEETKSRDYESSYTPSSSSSYDSGSYSSSSDSGSSSSSCDSGC